MDYSIVIPAFNEEDYIGATLDALTKAMDRLHRDGEIVVTDNRSTDNTGSIARDYGARVVFEPVNQISRARNTGAADARGRYLIFVDADTLVPAPLLETALRALDEGRLGGGGATILPDRPLPPIPAAGLRFWNGSSVTARIAAGSFIFCLREGFEAIGGFREDIFVAEEFFFSLQYRQWCKDRGLAFKILKNHPVVSSARKVEWFSPVQLALMTAAMICFPLVMHFKPFCGFWYRRPERSG